MKSICVLLNGPIISDSRVIREIKTLSVDNKVDLFYIHGTIADKEIFNANVRLFSVVKEENFRTKIVKHTCFYNEYLFFVDEVLKQGIKYDYVWANDLPDLKPAVEIKKKIGSKVIYDSHEIFLETLNQFFTDKAIFHKRILFKLALFTMKLFGSVSERNSVKKIDCFVTTCTSFKSYFEKKYNLQDVKIVMNCPNSSVIDGAYNFRQAFNLDKNDCIVVFQGMLNKGRALEEMIDAMQYTSPNIKLIVIGEGMLKKELQERAEQKTLTDKVFFIDRVPSNQLLYYTKGADVGINLQSGINLSKYLASANKLYEYIHANIPIIASNVPENKLTIEKYNLGYLVENTPFDIAAAINKMAVTDRSQFIENCNRAKQEYNWENQEVIISSIITNLI